MPLMIVFEPLFLLLLLIAVVSLGTAAVFAVTGRGARALRILRRLSLGAAAYFTIVIAVSVIGPRRIYRVGDMQCFDDWCVTVVGAERRAGPGAAGYDVSLRLSNRAKRVPMGEKGTVVYLTDGEGRRYDPVVQAGAVPFDTVLQPGASVMATRHFTVPLDAKDLGLIYTHEGGFPIGWLIVSEGGWFAKPPIVRLTP